MPHSLPPARPLPRLVGGLLGAVLLAGPAAPPARTDAQTAAPPASRLTVVSPEPRAPQVPGGTGGRPAAAPVPAAAPRAPAETSAPQARREAAKALRAWQDARKATARGTEAARRVHRSLASKRAAYAELRQAVGSAAAGQYRSGAGGLLSGARLALSDSPQEFLDRGATLTRGHRAGARLVAETRRAGAELEERRAATDRRLRTLRREQRRLGALARSTQVRAARAEVLASRGDAAVRRPPGHCARGGAPQPRSRGSRPASWVAPVVGYRLSSGYASHGARWARAHTGQDFAVPTGTPVRSVGPGVVAAAGCGGPFGHRLLVRHNDGHYTQYAHLSRLQAEPGQWVHPGQQIALSGSTGNSSGPHLHFEVRRTPRHGSAVDPVDWLRTRGVTL